MTTIPLWRWPDLCTACGATPEDGPDIHGISIDTRTLASGDLFVALSGDPGPRFHSSGSGGRDGHDFLPAAVDAGATGLLVSRDVSVPVPVIRTPDTLDALWGLGAAARARMTGQVVAITGSSGKTTARQWLQQILEHLGPTHASRGSLNNHWGVPLSLARMPAAASFGVFEVGTNNPGEIAPLSRLVRPDVALVLNVLPAHLGRFDNLDAIRREKLSIDAGIVPGGCLVLPDDLDPGDAANRHRVVTFGFSDQATVAGQISDGAGDSAGATRVDVRIGDRRWRYDLAVGGTHRAQTSLAVFAMLYALGADLDACAVLFRSVTTPEGRGNLVTAGEFQLIDDSYNANPVSMRHALLALAARSGQRVALLGEMLELGADGVAMHDSLAQSCEGLDGVITVGVGFADWQHSLGAHFWGHYEIPSDISLEQLRDRLRPGATILVKGANKVFWARGFVRQLVNSLGGGAS